VLVQLEIVSVKFDGEGHGSKFKVIDGKFTRQKHLSCSTQYKTGAMCSRIDMHTHDAPQLGIPIAKVKNPNPMLRVRI